MVTELSSASIPFCITAYSLAYVWNPQVEELDNKNEVSRDRVGKAKRERHLLDLIECEDANGNTALSEAASEL